MADPLSRKGAMVLLGRSALLLAFLFALYAVRLDRRTRPRQAGSQKASTPPGRLPATLAWQPLALLVTRRSRSNTCQLHEHAPAHGISA
jgi:hypothetical protein